MTIKEIEVQLALGTLSYDDKVELAENPNTPVEILTKLSEDKDWEVRCNVAINPRTSKKILAILSKDEHWYVRWNIARNISTPKKILERLLEDADYSTAFWASQTLEKKK